MYHHVLIGYSKLDIHNISLIKKVICNFWYISCVIGQCSKTCCMMNQENQLNKFMKLLLFWSLQGTYCGGCFRFLSISLQIGILDHLRKKKKKRHLHWANAINFKRKKSTKKKKKKTPTSSFSTSVNSSLSLLKETNLWSILSQNQEPYFNRMYLLIIFSESSPERLESKDKEEKGCYVMSQSLRNLHSSISNDSIPRWA